MSNKYFHRILRTASNPLASILALQMVAAISYGTQINNPFFRSDSSTAVYASGDKSNSFFALRESNSGKNTFEIREGSNLTRYVNGPDGSSIVSEEQRGDSKIKYEFQRFTKSEYLLTRISIVPLRSYYLDGGFLSSAKTILPVAPVSPQLSNEARVSGCNSTCPNPGFGKIAATLADAHKQIAQPLVSQCDSKEAVLRASIGSLKDETRKTKKASVACLRDFPGFSQASAKIEAWVSRPSELNLKCSETEKTQYDSKANAVIFGREVFATSKVDRLSGAVFHELLHAADVQSEVIDNSVVKCCVEGSAQGECNLVKAYSSSLPFFERSPDINSFMNDLIDSNKLSMKDKISWLQKLPKWTDVHSAEDKVKFTGDFAKLIRLACDQYKLRPDCESFDGRVRRNITAAAYAASTFYSGATQQMASAPANPEQSKLEPTTERATPKSDTKEKPNIKTEPTQILAEEPKYTPGGVSAQDTLAAAQRYEAPMAVVQQSAAGVAKTLAANAGWGVANAADLRMPERAADGSSSTTIANIDYSNHTSTLNALDGKGNPIKITTGTFNFAANSKMKFEVRNANTNQIIASGGTQTAEAGDGSRTVPKLSAAVLAKTGTTIPGRVDREESGGSGSSSSPGTASFASSSGSAQTQTSRPTIPSADLTVQQRVLRAPYTDVQRMRELYKAVYAADSKSYGPNEQNPSITFRYCNVNYPQGFKGNHFVNLDVHNSRHVESTCASNPRLDEQ